MACSKEYLCLKLHDHIKIKSHGDKSAVFPSFLRIICSGCHAMAVFSLRNDDFAVPMVGSATCWTVLSGRTSCCPGHGHSRGIIHTVFFAERGVLQKPCFLQDWQRQEPFHLQCSTEPRQRLGLTGLSPSLPHREWSQRPFSIYILHRNLFRSLLPRELALRCCHCL